jgi:hypothetical protein
MTGAVKLVSVHHFIAPRRKDEPTTISAPEQIAPPDCPSGKPAFESNPLLSLRSERGMRQAQFFGILFQRILRTCWMAIAGFGQVTYWPGYFFTAPV